MADVISAYSTRPVGGGRTSWRLVALPGAPRPGRWAISSPSANGPFDSLFSQAPAPLACQHPDCRVLVTGGSGFIGTNLIAFYRAHGVRHLLNTDIAPPRNPAHQDLWRRADITESDGIRRLVREFRPDVIFHLAARTDLNGALLADYAANIDGISHIIDAAAAVQPTPRVLFASSRLVCPTHYVPRDEYDVCPDTLYGRSKVETERLVRQTVAGRFEWLLLRPTSIWGPWFDAPYRNFFEAVERGLYRHPGRRSIPKSYGFVGNTAYQLDRLAFLWPRHLLGKTLYLSDYPPLDVRQWAGQVAKALGRRPPRSVPVSLLSIAARLGDLATRLGYREPPLTSWRLGNLLAPMVYDTKPLEDAVGRLPYSVEEGVAHTVAWMKAAHYHPSSTRMAITAAEP